MIANRYLSTEKTTIMQRIGVVVATAALVVAGTFRPMGTAQAAPAYRTAAATQVNTFLTRLAKQNLFMGSILIARNGKVLLHKGYGWANWESHVSNTRETSFRLADLTLQFTATAILQLQEAGKLNVQDRVASYLPTWPTAWKDVTIQQLLTHTSGVPNLYGDGVTGFDDSKYWSPEQIIGLAKDQPLQFKPGGDFHYSSIGYIALGLVIQKVSGEPYGQFLQEHIFGPAGMTRTGLAQDGVPIAHLARGYDLYERVTDFDATSYFSAGGLYSTVDDLYRWDTALSTNQLVSKQSVQAMFTPNHTFPDGSSYGYGWGMGTMQHHRIIDHGGLLRGFSTVNALFPDDGVTIIILSNNDQTAMNDIFTYVARAVLK